MTATPTPIKTLLAPLVVALRRIRLATIGDIELKIAERAKVREAFPPGQPVEGLTPEYRLRCAEISSAQEALRLLRRLDKALAGLSQCGAVREYPRPYGPAKRRRVKHSWAFQAGTLMLELFMFVQRSSHARPAPKALRAELASVPLPAELQAIFRAATYDRFAVPAWFGSAAPCGVAGAVEPVTSPDDILARLTKARVLSRMELAYVRRALETCSTTPQTQKMLVLPVRG